MASLTSNRHNNSQSLSDLSCKVFERHVDHLPRQLLRHVSPAFFQPLNNRHNKDSTNGIISIFKIINNFIKGTTLSKVTKALCIVYPYHMCHLLFQPLNNQHNICQQEQRPAQPTNIHKKNNTSSQQYCRPNSTAVPIFVSWLRTLQA